MAQIQSQPSLQAMTNISAALAVGTVLDNGLPRSNHMLFVTSGAGVSAGAVSIQISPDGTNWFTTASSVTTNAANGQFVTTLVNTPAQFVRPLISTGITGGTISAWVSSA